jgi:hypothetical protein
MRTVIYPQSGGLKGGPLMQVPTLLRKYLKHLEGPYLNNDGAESRITIRHDGNILYENANVTIR